MFVMCLAHDKHDFSTLYCSICEDLSQYLEKSGGDAAARWFSNSTFSGGKEAWSGLKELIIHFIGYNYKAAAQLWRSFLLQNSS